MKSLTSERRSSVQSASQLSLQVSSRTCSQTHLIAVNVSFSLVAYMLLYLGIPALQMKTFWTLKLEMKLLGVF